MAEGQSPEISIPDKKSSITERIRNKFNFPKQSPKRSREPSARDMSRRDFLKFGAKAAAAAGGAAVLSQITNAKNIFPSLPKVESEPKLITKTVILDIMPNNTIPLIPGYSTLEEFTNEVPPSKPLSTNFDTQNYLLDNSDALHDKFGDKFYPTALFTIMMNDKKDHGAKVADVYKKGEAFYGKSDTPVLYPLQGIYKNAKTREFTESGKNWENHGLEITFTADAVTPLLKEAKKGLNSKHTVFNLSWQLGNQEIIFGDPIPKSPTQWSTTKGSNGEELFLVYPDSAPLGPQNGEEQTVDGKKYYVYMGQKSFVDSMSKKKGWEDMWSHYILINGDPAIEAKPRIEAEKLYDYFEGVSEHKLIDSGGDPTTLIEIREAYRADAVQQNIQEVIKVAEAFPNDFFVVAAGNIKDDLRNQKLPSNLVTVAEWKEDNIKPTGQVYGADIYVPNSKLGLGDGSSFSVPFISATANEMLKKGVPLNEIKQRLQNDLSSQDQYRARTTGNPDSIPELANVLDIQKLQQKMQFNF